MPGQSSATTILFTDIEGSSALVESLGDLRWLDVLRAHNRIVREHLERYRGFEVKTVGDGFMIAFPSAAPAVTCAEAIQRSLARHFARAGGPALRVRMGLHSGVALEEGGDFFGRDVVMAARVMAQARGGEILVTEAVSDAAGTLRVGPGRDVVLKGLAGVHRVHPVVWRDTGHPAGHAAPDPGPSALEERADDEAALLDALDAAAEGRGGFVAVTAPAGLGKSALLRLVVAEAVRRGMATLIAQGGEIERPYTFGVARQLLETTMRRLPDTARADLLDADAARALGLAGGEAPPDGLDGEARAFRIYTALQDVVKHLARDAPLVLAVDDAHWADDPSLGWLGFLARRVREMPVLLVVAARDDEPRRPERLRDLLALRGASRLSPGPLSFDATMRLVRQTLPRATASFGEALHRASGGVPLYVRELATAARDAGVPPDDDGVARLPGITPEAVRRLVLARLEPLGEPAVAIARACATLDRRADIRLAGRLARLTPAQAVEAADALCGVGIFHARRPLGFVHPVMQAAVQAETPPGRRSALHRAAARLLGDDGAPDQEIALHLLATEPMEDAEVVGRLRAAAAASRADGSPADALRFLERALEEPPAPDALTDVLLEAAAAAGAAGHSERSAELARRALSHTEEATQRARIVAVLARAIEAELVRPDTRLDWDADCRPVLALIDAAVHRLEGADRALGFELEALRMNLLQSRLTMFSLPMAQEDERHLTDLAERATGGSPGEREILGSQAAWLSVRGNATVREVLALARRALADAADTGAALVWGSGEDSALEALPQCDAHAEAERHMLDAARRARRHGVPGAAALAAVNRCDNAWRAGRLDDALDLAAETAAYLREGGDDAYVASVAGGAVCGALLMQGRLDAAESTARGIEHPRLQRHALGLVAAARGDHATAAEHLRVAQETLDRRGLWRSGGPLRPVRPDLAVSLAAIGERHEARRVVELELEVARRFGAASCIAEALRAQAAVEQDPEPLREAARVIKGSEARLVEAAVLLELGRMTGDAAALDRARGIAERCGAHALADAARLASA